MSHCRLSHPEYRNWITVGRAIQITGNGLEAIIQNAVDKYHTSVLASLPNSVPVWKRHLTKAHRSTDKRKISWSNSDNTQWLTVGASWEIAKIFMAPLGPRKLDVVNAQTTDISGLLNILEWSPRGPNGIFNTGVSVSKITDARCARNSWAHAPLLHISDVDKTNAFANFTSLLQDPELNHDKNVQHAINELSNLSNNGLAVTEEKELELFVQLQRQLGQDVVSLRSNMTCWKDEVDANLEQIQGQKKSLDEFVKKNELQDLLGTVEKRIIDMEEQIIQDLQSTNNRLEKLEDNATSKSHKCYYDTKTSLKFNPVCDRMKEEFVGREWLFSTIDSWLENDLGPRESRAFLISGGPGTGKSTIVQELVRRHDGEKLVGYHYCQQDNPLSCDLESLVYNLSSMLLKSLPAYAALLTDLHTTAKKFHDDPKKLFDFLITTPLQQLEENTKQFFIIDGLDEGGQMIASCFARLSIKLPSWLRVILTARHNTITQSDLFLDSTFANLDHFTTNLESLFSANHRNINNDIREFVDMKYRKLQSEYNYIPSFFTNNEQDANKKIVQASQNCFLYAKLIMEHIFAGHDEIGLPASLSEIYCLDFRSRFPDIEFFERKVAPVLETVLAIQRANAFVEKETLIRSKLASAHRDNLAWMRLAFNAFMEGFVEGEDFVKGVVESRLLSSITMRDLNKALKLLSGYLVKDYFGNYYFSHSSIRDWLQNKTSDFFCDVINGHSIMASYNLKTLKIKVPSLEDFVKDICFNPDLAYSLARRSYSIALLKLKSFFIRYFFHSSHLPGSGISSVNVLISELSIEAIDLFHVAFDRMDVNIFPAIVRSEYLAMKVLNETDVLNKMSSKEKAEHLDMAIQANSGSITAKFIESAHWVFSSDVIFTFTITHGDKMEKVLHSVLKKGSLPHLFFSHMCFKHASMNFNVIVGFCIEHGVTMDACVPQFSLNTLPFHRSLCWNEDVQEYFRKLKSREKNVISLESLKEQPFYPEEAQVDDFTLHIIQKPIPEIERLVRDGTIFVSLRYAWHLGLKRYGHCLEVIDLFLKHGANVNNRGFFGITGLMHACKKQNDRLVSFFLEHEAEVNQQDFFGCTALHYAIAPREINLQPTLISFLREIHIVETLLHQKADPYLKNSAGFSAIDIAKQSGRIVLEKLMRHHAHVQENPTCNIL